MAIMIPVSPGEALDKLTILELKMARFKDESKIQYAVAEYTILRSVLDKILTLKGELNVLVNELRTVNSNLWCIENAIRRYEQEGDFGGKFTAHAREVYLQNDYRAEIKKKINLLLDSDIVEEKEYS